MTTKKNIYTRAQRKRRVNLSVKSSSNLPRVVVKRSNRHFHSQVIDGSGKVLAAFSSLALKSFKGTKTEQAKEVGAKLAIQADKNKLKSLVLDRGRYRFHGRIKAFVTSLQEAGIKI
jgi:large subunit ribosomal protein L18